MSDSDNNGNSVVIDLPKKEQVRDEDLDETTTGWVSNTHPFGFTSSWTSFVRTQIDYDGGFDL